MIAEDRAGRPNDFVDLGGSANPNKANPSKANPDQTSSNHTSSADCPFCAGPKCLTPEPSWEVVDADGQWQVRVVPNKFPAVAFDENNFSSTGFSALQSVPQIPMGAHEVLIESPRHVQDITELSCAELALVLQVYRDRLRHWSTDKRIKHVTLFKNVGNAAGASLEHIHSQLVALPDVPPVMAVELQAAEQYFDEQVICIFCHLLSEETTRGERLVCYDESFVAFCAYAGRQPYETWILPRKHTAHFEEITDPETESLALMLQEVVRRLQKQLAPLSYNLLLHTAPSGHLLSGCPYDECYHWHFELVPRSTQLAGFEWATGMHINPLSPERAAARLRGDNS